jgi:hypothetical protein
MSNNRRTAFPPSSSKTQRDPRCGQRACPAASPAFFFHKIRITFFAALVIALAAIVAVLSLYWAWVTGQGGDHD